LKIKFEIANNCLKKTVEYNKTREKFPLDSLSNEEYSSWIRREEDSLREIWVPLLEFQKNYPQEPNYYFKKRTYYSRVFFVPGAEDVNFIITNEKIPAKFIKNQVKNDLWSIVISQDFIHRYTILHLMWLLGISSTRPHDGKKECEDPFKNFQFPDFIPKCKHCDRHFQKLKPNQQYCETCRSTVKKMGFNPFTDPDRHRYCLNCGKHLPNGKHKKAKFCMGACRTAYFRKKQKEEPPNK
jgi:hypothetical protein